MSEEEINYWLEVFSEDRFAFKSKDGKVLSFYKTFENMKELQQENTQLKEELKDENNYHEEASKWYKEAYTQLKENQQLKSVLKEIREYIDKMTFDEYGVLYDNGNNLLTYEYAFRDKALEIIDKAGIGEDNG